MSRGCRPSSLISIALLRPAHCPTSSQTPPRRPAGGESREFDLFEDHIASRRRESPHRRRERRRERGEGIAGRRGGRGGAGREERVGDTLQQ
uniref:Uncharacterized protein n=1 Tax=Oryza sativa subsp. japonica TaxID=39947 RepID=Q6Z999_ORYSJ|nr:hypothetical protein [Oryza sativa Japonica Group]